MLERIVRASLLPALVAVVAGCAAPRIENQPLPAAAVNAERRVVDLTRAKRPLILVAISGGGSRAAALGWSVLREMSAFRYDDDGQPRRLTDDIAVVSSVSGGSVIAADFALNGAAGLDRFAADFLEPDNMRTLAIDVANPVTWAKLAFTGASRVDRVEALFDRQLFNNRTFAELNQRGKPYLIMNATDMSSGDVFAFTPKRFDDICADLDRTLISTGVAASSAVPVVLSPIALKNYAATDCVGVTPPPWIARRLNGKFAPYVNLANFKDARYANDLRHGPDSFRKIDYLYLVDGGVADNLGIHGLLAVIASPYAAPVVAGSASSGDQTILQAINNGAVDKVVVVVVNARGDAPSSIAESDALPGIVKMIGTVVSVPINSTTSSVASQMELLLAALGSGANSAADSRAKGLRIYGIQIDFDQLRAGDPAQRALRDQVKSIPTLWTISKENLTVLDQAGTALLHQHPCFQRLLSDLRVQADFVDPAFFNVGCQQVADR